MTGFFLGAKKSPPWCDEVIRQYHSSCSDQECDCSQTTLACVDSLRQDVGGQLLHGHVVLLGQGRRLSVLLPPSGLVEVLPAALVTPLLLLTVLPLLLILLLIVADQAPVRRSLLDADLKRSRIVMQGPPLITGPSFSENVSLEALWAEENLLH